MTDPDGPFSFWVGSNCCEWNGIECDSNTRRVICLSLTQAFDWSLGDRVLNASLFQPFKELRSLDLSLNTLVGCFENQCIFFLLLFYIYRNCLTYIRYFFLGPNSF